MGRKKRIKKTGRRLVEVLSDVTERITELESYLRGLPEGELRSFQSIVRMPRDEAVRVAGMEMDRGRRDMMLFAIALSARVSS